MRLKTKQNEKARSSPQISGVMVLHYNMVSPQMVSPGVGRHPLAMPLSKIAFFHKFYLQKYDVIRLSPYHWQPCVSQFCNITKRVLP